jgi:hypothetical protein
VPAETSPISSLTAAADPAGRSRVFVLVPEKKVTRATVAAEFAPAGAVDVFVTAVLETDGALVELDIVNALAARVAFGFHGGAFSSSCARTFHPLE